MGTGGGQFVHDLRAEGVDAYGLDLFFEQAQIDIPYLHEADILNSGLVGSQFDVIFVSMGPFSYAEYETNEDLALYLKELRRLAKFGGHFLISPTPRRRVTNLILPQVPGLRCLPFDQAWEAQFDLDPDADGYLELQKRRTWTDIVPVWSKNKSP